MTRKISIQDINRLIREAVEGMEEPQIANDIQAEADRIAQKYGFDNAVVEADPAGGYKITLNGSDATNRIYRNIMDRQSLKQDIGSPKYNLSKTMGNVTGRLNEAQLKTVIRESLMAILNENSDMGSANELIEKIKSTCGFDRVIINPYTIAFRLGRCEGNLSKPMYGEQITFSRTSDSDTPLENEVAFCEAVIKLKNSRLLDQCISILGRHDFS